MSINSINEMIGIAADLEAERRIVSMMNEQPFNEGSPDRFKMVARMIVKIWTEEASDRFNSTEQIEAVIKEAEENTFKSAFKEG